MLISITHSHKRGLSLLVAALLGVWLLLPASDVTFRREKIYIKSETRLWPLTVEIAETFRQQRQGLMYREKLEENSGMLFLFSYEQPVSMWMKNTPLSLDMLFIDDNGEIVHIVQGTMPNSTNMIYPGQPARAVLELPAGAVKTRGIRLGDQIIQATFTPRLRRKP